MEQQGHNTRKHMPTILSDTLSKEWMDEEVEKKRIEEIATFQIPSKEDL